MVDLDTYIHIHTVAFKYLLYHYMYQKALTIILQNPSECAHGQIESFKPELYLHVKLKI